MSERDAFRDLPDLPVPVLWRLALRELDLPPMVKLAAFIIDTYLGGKSRWSVAVPTIAARAPSSSGRAAVARGVVAV